MAKKIKFPLAMKNDVFVKDLNELRENFDLDKAVGYFLDGKLLRWLEARYYDTEAEAIKKLNSNAPDFKQQLCKIFDVDCPDIVNTDTDFDAVAEHNRKLTALKQYTSDSNLLAKVDSVAFNQEDLADLLDEDVHDIYLCDNSFVIPLRVENKRYIGIGKVEAVIRSAKRIDFKSLRIEFENINFDPAYAKLHEQTAEELYQIGQKAEEEYSYDTASNYYQKSAQMGNVEAMFRLAYFYKIGKGVEENLVKAMHWYKKVMQFTEYRARAMNAIGNIYRGQCENVKDINKATEWYEKAATLGNADAAYMLAWVYKYDNEKKDVGKAIEWSEKAVNLGNLDAIEYLISVEWDSTITACTKHLKKIAEDIEKIAARGNKKAMLYLGHIYSVGGDDIAKDSDKALEWYEKAANLGYTNALERLGKIYMKGDLVQPNYFKAIEYFEKSYALEDSILCYGIVEYFNDSNRNLDEFNSIVAQEEKSANLGNKWAMCRLAKLYEAGIWNNKVFTIENNFDKALEWYEKAANHGSLAAVNQLANIFCGVNIWIGERKYKNFQKAVKWLEKRVAMWTYGGDYIALGDIYMEGDDTLPKDVHKATEWYEKAYNIGYSDAFKKIDYFKILLQE